MLNMIRIPILLRTFVYCSLLVCSQNIECNPTCKNPCEPNGEYDHWFTGPIFTPNPTTVQPDHPGIEPVLIFSKTYGLYDNKWKKQSIPKIWSIGPYVDFQAGFTKRFAIELIGSMVSNFSQGASSTHLRDWIFRMGYQISTDKQNSWVPDFRILFQETFPTGKYQKLSVQKKGTDLTGQGAFQTGIHLAFQKLFRLWSTHCLSIRGDVGYLIPARVSVKGLNYYTGIYSVKGNVRPGQIFVAYLTGECSLSSKWNLCCENFYQYQRNGHFLGKIKGKTSIDHPSIKVRAFSQYIIAPEIQHTITPNVGVVIGGASTILGKNAPAFWSGFFAVLYMF